MNRRSTLLLEHHLKELKLPTFLREYGKMATQCAAEGVDHPQYLLRLAELELIDRHQRMVQRRIRAARFPAVKSLDTFDFTAIPSVNKPLVLELARCEYVQNRENVIAVGNSGTAHCLNKTVTQRKWLPQIKCYPKSGRQSRGRRHQQDGKTGIAGDDPRPLPSFIEA